MHPRAHALAKPTKPAVIMAGTGEAMSYAELDAGSNRVAQLLRHEGLGVGEVVALVMENRLDWFPLVWGVQRAGGVLVAVSTRLTADETAYILRDSGARLLIASEGAGPAIRDARRSLPELPAFLLGPEQDGWRNLAATLALMPPSPIPDERAGVDMLYSSGTTGRPKGVHVPLPEDPRIDAPTVLAHIVEQLFGIGGDDIYLSTAPLYHAAPLRWSMAVQRLGGTVVVMERFEPEAALAAIERYRVTSGQFVPTHFARMLKLPDAVRARYDLSSLRCAVHAAAPCPVPVKQAMIAWWGPVLKEYYAGSEGNGLTFIDSEQWLARPGSVGRAVVGTLRICDAEGRELPPGEEGLVYFEGGSPFAYHNDPERTAAATHPKGWTTLGDIGRLDGDGYLTLTDRRDFLIISGGVNISPQEVEGWLISHPKIADAAVIGAPDEDLGEQVVAVVQPLDPAAAGPVLAEELLAWLRPRLSPVKLPRRIDFRPELPRHATGKLYKRLLRDEYRARGGS